MSRRSAVFLTIVALLGGAVVAAFGEVPGRRVLPGGEPRFHPDEVTWSLGSTIHQGDATYDVGAELVRDLLATRYGFFLTLTESPHVDAERRLAWFDGEQVVDVPGRVSGHVSGIEVSPDGRFAGWVDREGPLSPAGRIAEAVVVDLQTGRAVFRDHENMGGEWGDDLADLYGELDPRFVGFDVEGRAYWQDASGHGERWRLDLDTGQKENVDGVRSARPVDPLLSPDGRFRVGDTYSQRVQVTAERRGRRIRLDHGNRNAFFGGWLDGGRSLYALATNDYRTMLDIGAPQDRTRGTLVSCRLPSGHCTTLEQIHGLRSFKFSDGYSFGY